MCQARIRWKFDGIIELRLKMLTVQLGGDLCHSRPLLIASEDFAVSAENKSVHDILEQTKKILRGVRRWMDESDSVGMILAHDPQWRKSVPLLMQKEIKVVD